MFKIVAKRTTLIFVILGLHAKVVYAQKLPEISFNTAYSNQFGLVANLRYANLLNMTNALGGEVAFGSSEFRLGGTFAKMINAKHGIRLSTEYLSQDISFNFQSGYHTLWNEQSSLAGGYTYFLNPRSEFNCSIYGTSARDERLPTKIMNDQSVFQEVKGSYSYGLSTGISLIPWPSARLKGDIYYDTVSYHNRFETAPNREGIGVGVNLEEVLTPYILLCASFLERKIYQEVSGSLHWLILATTCSSLELTLTGSILTGSLPQPHEQRIGVMLSYRWGDYKLRPDFLSSKTLPEAILAQAVKPLIRMPQVLVCKDEHTTIER